jgi:pSer/pThr/pTyr-binding forkhead associated (FHA) protein
MRGDEPEEGTSEGLSTTIPGTWPLPGPEPVSRPSTLQVEVLGGPMDGQRRRVNKTSLTIGRASSNDLPLHLDPLVSTRHARIVCEGRSYWLEDLDSSNGTWVGDERIAGRVLISPGAVFAVGDTRLEFLPA